MPIAQHFRAVRVSIFRSVIFTISPRASLWLVGAGVVKKDAQFFVAILASGESNKSGLSFRYRRALPNEKLKTREKNVPRETAGRERVNLKNGGFWLVDEGWITIE